MGEKNKGDSFILVSRTNRSQVRTSEQTKRQKNKKWQKESPKKRQKDKNRYCDTRVISHGLCNHEIFWFWCNISPNIKPWDIVVLFNISQNLQPSNNQFKSNQSIKTVVQTSASPYSFAVFFSCLDDGRDMSLSLPLGLQ